MDNKVPIRGLLAHLPQLLRLVICERTVMVKNYDSPDSFFCQNRRNLPGYLRRHFGLGGSGGNVVQHRLFRLNCRGFAFPEMIGANQCVGRFATRCQTGPRWCKSPKCRLGGQNPVFLLQLI